MSRGEILGDEARLQTNSRKRQTIRSDGTREFYTVAQIARLLQVTEMTIYKIVKRGDLPCYAIGRVKRFRLGDLEQFLEDSRFPIPVEPHST